MKTKLMLVLVATVCVINLAAQTNPLWSEKKIKNYLPHMTVPEVNDFLKRSDMVIIPLGAMEQHGYHLPMGTDFINGVERCKLLAQQRDILVVPVLMAGQSPYHMGFAGTITMKAETIIQVHMEAVESLLVHGFKRFVIMTAHTGNTAITAMLVDKINQTTGGIAVAYDQAVQPFMEQQTNTNAQPANATARAAVLDQHAGTPETSNGLYLMPTLVQLEKGMPSKLTLPPHLQAMVPQVVARDPTAVLVFGAESLKAKETGKKTSTMEIASVGVYGERDPKESTAERGATSVNRSIAAAVKFIDKWNELRPYPAKK